jgi:hypothetical protein
MRKAAKILVAGTLVAIPLQLLWCAAATSQTPPPVPPENSHVLTQVNLAPVFAQSTINVVSADSVPTPPTLAIGNTYTGAVTGGSMREDLMQSERNDVRARTDINVTGYAGTMVQETGAYGNVHQSVADGDGSMSGGTTQRVADGQRIVAQTNINAYGASLGPLTSMQTTAVANDRGIGIEGGGTASEVVSQTNRGQAVARNTAVFGYTAGEADFSALAVSNNITATGTVGSSQILTADQVMSGQRTMAVGGVYTGNAQTINNVATATANNITATNDGGPLDMAVNQSNSAGVRALATNVAYAFGTNNAMAYGVGNSISAGETGIELNMDFSQSNSARVEAIADVGGTTGYDAQATSIAMGNAATGFVCSTCGGTLEINGTQVKSANIRARSTVTIAGSNRSAGAGATAVGNSATFYATSPGN